MRLRGQLPLLLQIVRREIERRRLELVELLLVGIWGYRHNGLCRSLLVYLPMRVLLGGY